MPESPCIGTCCRKIAKRCGSPGISGLSGAVCWCGWPAARRVRWSRTRRVFTLLPVLNSGKPDRGLGDIYRLHVARALTRFCYSETPVCGGDIVSADPGQSPEPG